MAVATQIVGRHQPRFALRNMVLALSLHPWLNTPEERLRLNAAKHILKHWEVYRVLTQNRKPKGK